MLQQLWPTTTAAVAFRGPASSNARMYRVRQPRDKNMAFVATFKKCHWSWKLRENGFAIQPGNKF